MVLVGGITLALIAAVLAVVLLSGRDEALAGTWAGQVSQAGSTYTLEVTLTEVDGQVSGRSLYPELNCGGTWTQTARSDATVTVVERIDHGIQLCIDGSSATLAVDQEGRLQVDGGYWQATLMRSD